MTLSLHILFLFKRGVLSGAGSCTIKSHLSNDSIECPIRNEMAEIRIRTNNSVSFSYLTALELAIDAGDNPVMSLYHHAESISVRSLIIDAYESFFQTDGKPLISFSHPLIEKK